MYIFVCGLNTCLIVFHCVSNVFSFNKSKSFYFDSFFISIHFNPFFLNSFLKPLLMTSSEENEPERSEVFVEVFDLLFGPRTTFALFFLPSPNQFSAAHADAIRREVNARITSRRNITNTNITGGRRSTRRARVNNTSSDATTNTGNNSTSPGTSSGPFSFDSLIFHDSNDIIPILHFAPHAAHRHMFRAMHQTDNADPQFLENLNQIIQEILLSSEKMERVKRKILSHKPDFYKKNREYPAECTVCLSQFKTRQQIRKLACEHVFHKQCIDKWLLSGHPCCPLCRKEPFK
jgi:hypothetical protein